MTDCTVQYEKPWWTVRLDGDIVGRFRTYDLAERFWSQVMATRNLIEGDTP